jgi:hypothetical protein
METADVFDSEELAAAFVNVRALTAMGFSNVATDLSVTASYPPPAYRV